MQAKPIRYDEYSEEQLLNMTREQATKGLAERQQRFCEFYVEGFNRKLALLKAGYQETTPTYANRLLLHDKIKRYIQWLKVRIINDR